MSAVFTAPAAFSDLKRRVLDSDPAGISSVATDFSFDFSVDACWVAGVRPADGASAKVSVGKDIFVDWFAPGSLADGTYALEVETPGTGTGFAGTVTIAGGAVTAKQVTNPGSGYTGGAWLHLVFTAATLAGLVTPPNYQFRASTASVRSLARVASSFLDRTGFIQAANMTAPTALVRAGQGVALPGGYDHGLFVQKSGTPTEDIGKPAVEGFADTLTTHVLRNNATDPSAWSLGGPPGAFRVSYGAAPNGAIDPGPYYTDKLRADNTLMQVGALVRFDRTANTTQVYLVYNGTLSSLPVADAGDPDAFADTDIGTCLGGYPGQLSATGTLYRAYKEWVGLAGFTNDEIAAKVAREWEYAQARFA